MYWAVGMAVAIGAVAWLTASEREACERYNRAYNRLNRETRQRQVDIRKQIAKNATEQDYYANVQLHYASIITANEQYEVYALQKNLLAERKRNLHAFGQQIGALKKQRDVATKADKDAIRQKLAVVRNCHKECKEQIDMLVAQKNQLLSDVQTLNEQTRQYKLYIRDNCGYKGRQWYERSQERARLRAS